MNNKPYIPYVYFIKNKTTKAKYIGVKYAKGCNPDDFWVTYFTSSKLVKKLIEEFGKDDFYVKILHKFPNDPKAAILKESEYFEVIKKRDDYLNVNYSSGCLNLEINSKAGKIGGMLCKSRKLGIFRCENERKIWASLGGKAGSRVQIENKIGIYAYTPEKRVEIAKLGNAKIKELGLGFYCSKTQSELGRRGGKKNKGFKWYNDGNSAFKYTKADQEKLPFEEFLEKNPNYARGTNCGKSKEN